MEKEGAQEEKEVEDKEEDKEGKNVEANMEVKDAFTVNNMGILPESAPRRAWGRDSMAR